MKIEAQTFFTKYQLLTIKLLKNPFPTLGGIFDGNKIKEKIENLNNEVLKKDFWKDNLGKRNWKFEQKSFCLFKNKYT